MKQLACIALAVFCIFCLSFAYADTCYQGSGDDVVELKPFSGYYVFEIEGNAQSRYFGVIPYDADGNRMSSIVNTTDVYHGVVIEDKQSAAFLEVKASGKWTITQKPISSLKTVTKGQTISGSGDSVFIFDDSMGTSMIATITGNKSSSYFGVIPYDASCKRMSSLVNTTDVYSGNVMLKGEPRIFEVQADGAWSITFK